MADKIQKNLLTANTVMQKLNRKTAYRIRHWDGYVSGMFTQADCDHINNAFDELCVLYKKYSLQEIPVGDSMLEQLSCWLEEACKRLTKRERLALYAEYKKISCPVLKRDACEVADCAGCEPFQEYLVSEFESYLCDYLTVKIEKAAYG